MKMHHRFVKFIPNELEEGVLYIAIDYGTVLHKCCCGCGNEVNTPLSPNEWRLIYDGDSVTLKPSIGNWSFECKSHYWITSDEIEWDEKWNVNKIKKGRQQEQVERDKYYKDKLKNKPSPKTSPTVKPIKNKCWFKHLFFWNQKKE